MTTQKKRKKYQRVSETARSNRSQIVGRQSVLRLQIPDYQGQHHRTQQATIRMWWCECVWQLGAEQQQVHFRSATHKNGQIHWSRSNWWAVQTKEIPKYKRVPKLGMLRQQWLHNKQTTICIRSCCFKIRRDHRSEGGLWQGRSWVVSQWSYTSDCQ